MIEARSLALRGGFERTSDSLLTIIMISIEMEGRRFEGQEALGVDFQETPV